MRTSIRLKKASLSQILHGETTGIPYASHIVMVAAHSLPP